MKMTMERRLLLLVKIYLKLLLAQVLVICNVTFPEVMILKF